MNPRSDCFLWAQPKQFKKRKFWICIISDHENGAMNVFDEMNKQDPPATTAIFSNFFVQNAF